MLIPTTRLIIILLALSLFARAQAAEQPNVIIIVADDLGWADVGFHGSKIDTPALDRLAAEGARLERFYTAPSCSPSRAALMTGRDPMRLGIAYATVMPWSVNGVHPDEHFMPQSFQAAGYQTAMVGKWHLGHAQESYHPNQRGFEHFYGHLHTNVGYFPPFGAQGGVDFQRNGQTIDDQGYESYLLADESVAWIKARQQDKPFFLYMPFIAPHTPFDAPDDLKQKYADFKDERGKTRSRSDRSRLVSKLLLQDSARPMYAAVVEGMDRAIGRVLATLDEEGIADNTIVLFFSDNGGAVYAMGGADNAPYRGGKGDTFEGGIRVAAALRWPAQVPAGSEVNSIMTVMDVFPTFSAAAGVKPGTKKSLDGRNMLPAITEGQHLPREDLVFFAAETPIRGSFAFTAFNEEWKLVQEVQRDFLSSELTHYLFNIQDDPYEYNNLADKHPDVVQELAAELHKWRMLYPVNGTRSNLVPPPGWRAPKDWAVSMRKLDELQTEPAPGMPPKVGLRPLDWMHGENGRLIYDCTPKPWLFGVCLEND